jgi:hypothetical protein
MKRALRVLLVVFCLAVWPVGFAIAFGAVANAEGINLAVSMTLGALFGVFFGLAFAGLLKGRWVDAVFGPEGDDGQEGRQ